MIFSFGKKILLGALTLSLVFFPGSLFAESDLSPEQKELVDKGEVPIGWQCKVEMKVQGVFATFINDNLVGKSVAEQAQIIAGQPGNALCSIEDYQSNTSLVKSNYRYGMHKKIDLFALANSIFRVTKQRAKKEGFLGYFDSGQKNFVELASWDSGEVVNRCVALPKDVLLALGDRLGWNTEFPILRSGQTTKETVTPEGGCALGQNGGNYQGIYPAGNSFYIVTFKITNDRLYYVKEKLEDAGEDEPASTPFSLPISLNECAGAGLNPFGCVSIPQLIGRAMSIVIGLLGTFALLWFVYAGIMWMFAGGNSDRQKRALMMILWGALGLLMIFASYAILTFVLDAFK